MVSASVLLTVIILHFGFQPHPMPKWVEYLFLEKLDKIFCLFEKDDTDSEEDPLHYQNAAYDDVNSSNKTIHEKTEFQESVQFNPELIKIIQQLEYIRLNTMHQNKVEDVLYKWKRVAKVMDRILFLSFIVLAVLTTSIMIPQVYWGGETDYQKLYSKYISNSTNSSTLEDDWVTRSKDMKDGSIVRLVALQMKIITIRTYPDVALLASYLWFL